MQTCNTILGAVAFHKKKHLMVVVAVFQALTAVAVVVGLIIYSQFFEREKFTVDWSYIIGWGGAVCIFVALSLLIVLLRNPQRMPLETAFVYENSREGY